MSVSTKVKAEPVLQVRVFWKDATGQSREDFCKVSDLVVKLSEIEANRGRLVSISAATHHNVPAHVPSPPSPQRSSK